MNFIAKLTPILFSQNIKNGLFHSVTVQNATETVGGLFDVITRSIVRNHFPRPSEVKRIKRHGFKKRLSTPEGRRILMNRILKGRHVISH